MDEGVLHLETSEFLQEAIPDALEWPPPSPPLAIEHSQETRLSLPCQDGLEIPAPEACAADEAGPTDHSAASLLQPFALDAQ